MTTNDIAFMSATELGSAIKSKEVSPVEAVEAYLDRIERIDPQVNSYITVCAEQARGEALQAEAEIRRGEYRGPLHGIPMGIKDQIYTKGLLTTDASKIRSDFIPKFDATVVTNLKKAGAVLLGKLNMSEFAHGEPQSSASGPARNPWDLTRSPGVSSTGSGAATAARLCATSLGEDTGGSIRGPAANCGLVGLRPTWGRVSRYGVDGAGWSFDTIGPISRTVEDCAITIGGIAGYYGGLVDDALADTLVREALSTMYWLRAQGCRWVLMTGRQAHRVEGKLVFFGGLIVEAVGGGAGLSDRLFESALDAGADVRYEHKLTSLVMEGPRVVGAVVRTPRGDDTITADAVVLAAGGFEANTEMRTRYLGAGWDLAKVRGSRFNTGDAIRAALDAGAAPGIAPLGRGRPLADLQAWRARLAVRHGNGAG